MHKCILVSLLASGLATAAGASPITVQYFTGSSAISDVNAALTTIGPPSWIVEDFEDQSDFTGLFENGDKIDGTGTTKFGEIAGSIGTAVGSFTALGGIGTGSTCQALDRGTASDKECDNIALQFDPDVNGQGNISPETGQWSLNSADTKGLKWTVETGGVFSSVIFALRDPGDQNAKRLKITGAGAVFDENMPGLVGNNDIVLARVDFGGQLTQAHIEIETSRNDAFTIDAASVNVVPLPAGVWMLLAGIGGLAALKRRKTA
ncbi:MAG: VPLPA-CTERM sorting domain-containing protein [Roseicyclus sp.]